MSTLDHTLGFLQYDAGNLYVTVGGFIEGRGNDLCIDGTSHIRNLLRTLVDEQHHDVGLRMVGGNSVGNILHQNGFTSLGLSHDECTLTFTDRGEKVDDTYRRIGGCLVTAKRELLFWEQRRQVLEGHTVAHFMRLASVDGLDIAHRKIFLIIVRRTDSTIHNITSLQRILLDLLWRYVDVVGR